MSGSRQVLVDLGAQWADIRAELLPEIEAIFASGGFIGGDRVRRFETEFAAFCRRPHCVGVANGTDALTLALLALGIGKGDEVITVPMSFVATVEAIVHSGAHPVFVDVRADDLLMDPAQLDRARTPRTRAVIPVHLYGQLADMEKIVAWCARHGLGLVEDAAQAHGARLRGRPAGAFGDAAAFSFYPAKNLGAAGDAGAIVTGRDDVAQRARMLRDHGQSSRYHHDLDGYNSRLDALQAAVLSVKLRRLARWTERRQALAAIYRERLAKIAGLELLAVPEDPDSHAYHLFVIRIPERHARGTGVPERDTRRTGVTERDALRKALDDDGIETGLHYPLPIHLQPVFASLGHGPGSFPVAEAAAREVLSLPLYPEMSEDAVHRVCDSVERFLRRR